MRRRARTARLPGRACWGSCLALPRVKKLKLEKEKRQIVSSLLRNRPRDRLLQSARLVERFRKHEPVMPLAGGCVLGRQAHGQAGTPLPHPPPHPPRQPPPPPAPPPHP